MLSAKQIGLTTVVSIEFPEKRQFEEISGVFFFFGKFPAKLQKTKRGEGSEKDKTKTKQKREQSDSQGLSRAKLAQFGERLDDQLVANPVT